VPAQVVPGPAAQSFSPLGATPKHLSMVGCGGFGPATAAVVTIANAAAKELAIVAAVKALLQVIVDPFKKTGMKP
jgi:hypothetical protein